jgi:hypothetical protein
MVVGFNDVTPVLGSLAQLLTSARQAMTMTNKMELLSIATAVSS